MEFQVGDIVKIKGDTEWKGSIGRIIRITKKPWPYRVEIIYESGTKTDIEYTWFDDTQMKILKNVPDRILARLI